MQHMLAHLFRVDGRSSMLEYIAVSERRDER
jgi:hypothetical protein